jgi:hypothetical protein
MADGEDGRQAMLHRCNGVHALLHTRTVSVLQHGLRSGILMPDIEQTWNAFTGITGITGIGNNLHARAWRL